MHAVDNPVQLVLTTLNGQEPVSTHWAVPEKLSVQQAFQATFHLMI